MSVDRDNRGRWRQRDSFMEPETDYGVGLCVDTRQGLWYVPPAVVDQALTAGRQYEPGSEMWDSIVTLYGDYVEPHAEDWYSVEVVRGWFGRYQAPGYRDATEWSFDTNRRNLLRGLREMYGE